VDTDRKHTTNSNEMLVFVTQQVQLRHIGELYRIMHTQCVLERWVVHKNEVERNLYVGESKSIRTQFV
jgi:hypothetical protein